ncbi:DUF599 family protein [Variovorax sp. J22R24]|uniref:DUF599 family protein n=1 Tax=Variovorax gracilis TaxID=3053502 RepID=UPI002577AEC3|nr:DUF599 family protein [Variovorax sp. J22R24]MDM0110217.1 DUF599 family protein [Variovorax sp. J22R24]
MALLLASLLSSVMAVRYYNHAGFISAMPVGSDARSRWRDAGIAYLRRAGILYSWGLRHLVLVAPILASIVHPPGRPIQRCMPTTIEPSPKGPEASGSAPHLVRPCKSD